MGDASWTGLTLERDTLKQGGTVRHWARYVHPKTLERYGGAYGDTPEEAEALARSVWSAGQASKAGPTRDDLIAALRKLEWTGDAGCEGMGFMGSGPPMHRHPMCPLCRGHEPEFNAKAPNCFRTRADSERLGMSKGSGVNIGHESECLYARLVATS